MERCTQRFRFPKVIAMLTALLIFMSFGTFNAYALNENYAIDEYHYWLDVDNQYNYQREIDGFDGFLKSVSDESDGCFYTYFRFYDTRIFNSDDENIVLTFTIENSENSYQFSVNKDGFINTGQNDINAVKLVSNFDSFACSSMGGEIFIGFELKNTADRVLTNYISCDYAAGVSTTAALFENEVLDLYVEPTKKATTEKRTTEKKSTTSKSKTTQSKSSVSSKSSTAKTSKSNSAATTKFKGSGAYITDSSYEDYDDNNDIESEEDVSDYIQPQSSDAEMSNIAVIILIASIAAIVAGIIVLAFALAAKAKKKAAMEEDEESSP